MPSALAVPRSPVRHDASEPSLTFLAPLTAREIEVLELIAAGLGNREIAEALHLSEETVKTHVQRLLRKLRAMSRAHAVAIAFRHRLVV